MYKYMATNKNVSPLLYKKSLKISVSIFTILNSAEKF